MWPKMTFHPIFSTAIQFYLLKSQKSKSLTAHHSRGSRDTVGKHLGGGTVPTVPLDMLASPWLDYYRTYQNNLETKWP